MNNACVTQPESGAAHERTPDNRVQLTWEDLEAHKDVLTELQWQRITEYFHHGRGLSRIHAGEDRARRTLKTATEQSIGRACIRLLRSMLGMRVRDPAEKAAPRDEQPGTRQPSGDAPDGVTEAAAGSISVEVQG